MKTCKIDGCTAEHHARGFCNRHYHKQLRHGDPLKGKTYKDHTRGGNKNTEGMERLPVLPRSSGIDGVKNLSFELNEDLINKLWAEAVRTTHKPLYKGINGKALNPLFILAINLAGCHNPSRLFLAEMIEDLLTWANCRDKIQFMNTLRDWQQRQEAFEGKNSSQLNLFSLK